jgi:hypothetical protein
MADKTKKVLTIEIDVESGEVKNLNEELKSTKKESQQLTGTLDKMSGGAITAFKSMVSGVKSAVLGFKSLRLAVMATGIGALVVAFASLMAYFQKTERGAQQLRVIMAVFGAAINAVVDVVIHLGESIFNAFTNPKQAIEDLGDAIKYYFTEFIPNAIKKVLDGFGLLGKALKKLISGDLDGALADATEGVNKLGDGLTDLNPATAIIKELTKSVIELGEEIIKDANAAAELEARMNALIVAERELGVARSETNKEIAKARLMAEDESLSAEERLKAIKQAVALEKAQTLSELALERERLDIMQAQADLSESNEDTLNAIAQQRSKIIDLETASLTTQKRLATEISSFEKEIAAAIEARLKLQQESNATLIDVEKQRQDALVKMNKDALQLIDADRKLDYVNYDEINKKKLESDRALEQAKMGLAIDAFGALIALNNAFAGATEEQQRKAFQRDKALKIGQAIMSTAQAVTSALAQTIDPTPLQVLRFGNAAVAAAMGIAQVATIAKTQFNPSGGSSGGGVPSVSAPTATAQAPQFNTVGTSGFNQLSDSIAGQNQRPVQAYVVANDVSSAQSLDRNRVKQASFP